MTSTRMVVVIPAASVLLMFVFLPGCECVNIVTPPRDTEYAEGSLAIIFCVFDDLGEDDDLFWKIKDSKRITESEKYIITSDHDADSVQFSLKIRAVQRSDQNEYQCGYTKNGQTHMSEPAKINILEVPAERYPRIQQNEQYRAGRTATILCVTEDTNPKPEIELFRSDTDTALNTIEDNDVHADTITILYSFIPTTEDNNAEFSCRMTCPGLTQNCKRSTKVSINVQFAPIISIKHEQVIEVGKIAILICETTDSNPDATEYEWSEKNGVGFNDKFSINGKIMRIENPTEDLNGTVLVCSVTNSIGRTQKDVTLYVSSLGLSGSDGPSTIADPAELNNEQQSMDILLKTVIIAGIITISVITLLVLPLCLHHVCINRHAIDSLGRKISQPQIYFEAHDRVLPTPPDNMDNYTWKRSLAVQVPDDLEIDIELVYQEISEKSRSNRNTLVKNTSTYS